MSEYILKRYSTNVYAMKKVVKTVFFCGSLLAICICAFPIDRRLTNKINGWQFVAFYACVDKRQFITWSLWCESHENVLSVAMKSQKFQKWMNKANWSPKKIHKFHVNLLVSDVSHHRPKFPKYFLDVVCFD